MFAPAKAPSVTLEDVLNMPCKGTAEDAINTIQKAVEFLMIPGTSNTDRGEAIDHVQDQIKAYSGLLQRDCGELPPLPRHVLLSRNEEGPGSLEDRRLPSGINPGVIYEQIRDTHRHLYEKIAKEGKLLQLKDMMNKEIMDDARFGGTDSVVFR